jgi:tetratricopeptide (TPR) repeat protein
MRFCLQAVFFSVVFNVGPGVAAQDLSRGSSTVEGLISRTGAFGVAGVEVQLVSERDMVVHRAFPDRGGTFRFDGIPTGRYELRVNNLGGDLLHRELLAVRGQTTHVAVELPGPPASAPPGTVSIAELQRKVSPRAQKEFRRAEQAIEKGKLEEAVARLRKALATDSHYVDAHVNLGACLARLKRHEEAAEQFAIAVRLDPNSAPARANFGHVLLYLNRFAEAETQLRQAVRLEPQSDQNQYLLGLALRSQERDDEALPYFERAAGTVPMAHTLAAEVLAQRGRNREAARHLRDYLKEGKVENRAAMESWLRRLEREPPG